MWRFYSHAPRGARLTCTFHKYNITQVSTHTPLAGRDHQQCCRESRTTVSTHTPLAGRDGLEMTIDLYYVVSTHTPLAGRDRTKRSCRAKTQVSTHTPLAGRDDKAGGTGNFTIVSTHTPLAGRDEEWVCHVHDHRRFYSHAPRGARPPNLVHDQFAEKFLLTRPSRGATAATAQKAARNMFLLTRPSRGATYESGWYKIIKGVSTHTPLAGRDQRGRWAYIPAKSFYSHAPRGARRAGNSTEQNITGFYSHAPRGARHGRAATGTGHHCFYSHAPRGARLSGI